MQVNPVLSSEIQTNFENLRSAVEDRRYQDIESLLREQRILVKDLPIADPDVRDTLRQAQELIFWSLTMVNIQRSTLERRLTDINQLKCVEKYQDCSSATDRLASQLLGE